MIQSVDEGVLFSLKVIELETKGAHSPAVSMLHHTLHQSDGLTLSFMTISSHPLPENWVFRDTEHLLRKRDERIFTNIPIYTENVFEEHTQA